MLLNFTPKKFFGVFCVDKRTLSSVFLLIFLFACSYNSNQIWSIRKDYPDGMELSISSKNWKKLVNKRTEALQVGHLFKEKGDKVGVIVSGNGGAINCKVRLKGDELDHLTSSKWSFRLQTKEKEGFAGHQKISLQNPATKNDLWEWIFIETARKEGLLAVHYDFLPLKINGKPQGLYAVESVPDNEILREGNRPLAPIIRFEEQGFWKEFLMVKHGIDSLHMLKAEISLMNKNWLKKNSRGRQLVEEAKIKLDRFRKRQIAASECWDYDLMAKYVALSELFGTSHNLRWINLRLYFSPKSQKFEPIVSDCFDGETPRTAVLWYNKKNQFEYLLHPLLHDEEFKKQVRYHLKEYSSAFFIKNIFAHLHGELIEAVSLFKQENRHFTLSRNELLARGALIQTHLSNEYIK